MSNIAECIQSPLNPIEELREKEQSIKRQISDLEDELVDIARKIREMEKELFGHPIIKILDLFNLDSISSRIQKDNITTVRVYTDWTCSQKCGAFSIKYKFNNNKIKIMHYVRPDELYFTSYIMWNNSKWDYNIVDLFEAFPKNEFNEPYKFRDYVHNTIAKTDINHKKDVFLGVMLLGLFFLIVFKRMKNVEMEKMINTDENGDIYGYID